MWEMLGTLLVTHVTMLLLLRKVHNLHGKTMQNPQSRLWKSETDSVWSMAKGAWQIWQKCPSLNCHGSCGDRGKAAESLGVFGQSWGSQSCSALDEILHISRSKLFQNSMLQISF